MKKSLLIPLFLAFSLTACGTKSTTQQSINPGTPTDIEVIGANKVEVGKTIVLACDVVGTTNDEVAYSSSDTNIATVDNDGVITGVSVGNVVITIASVQDPSISVQYNIEVIGTKSKEVSVVLMEGTEYTYDDETSTYSVSLGKTFYVTYKLTAGSSAPKNVAFSLILPGSASSSIASLTQIDDTKAKVETFGKIDGLVVKVTISYAADGSDAISNATTINVVDENEVKMSQVKSMLNGTLDVEAESLTSVKYSRERTDSSENSRVTTSIDYSSYKDATYAKEIKKTTVSGSTQTRTTNYYSGIDGNHSKVFFFSYNLGGIKEIYINQEASSSDRKNAPMIGFTTGGLPTFGMGNIINESALLNGTITDNIYGLSSLDLYANASFRITDNEVAIYSTYLDEDYGVTYTANLSIGFESGKLTRYSFVETVVSDSKTITYSESFTDFVYGEKQYDNTTTNSNHLDITKYYLTSYNLVDISGETGEIGEYDFSNLDKYGPDSVTEEDGITHYTLTYDKTLVLGIKDIAPSTANTNIDVLDCKSNDTEQIPNPTHIGNNIYSVTAKTNVYGIALTGDATLTFTSINGITKTIRVTFTKPELRGILVTGITNNDLGSVFEDESSNYFFLNAIPDEDIYSYELDVVSGDASGIQLYRNAYDNLDGYPGFSYCVRGLKVGNYTFRFKISGSDFESDIYSIEVKEAYSKEYLVSELVTSGRVYQYAPGGTVKFTLQFTSETNLRLTQYNLYDSSTLTRDIAVTIQKGKVLVNDTQTIFGNATDNMFFYSILGGKIAFNDSLTQIYPYLDTYEGSIKGPTGHYAKYTFTEKIDPTTLDTYIKGKTIKASTYVSGFGMVTSTIAFDESQNKATLLAYDPNNKTIGNISFTWTYNASQLEFALNNVTSSSNTVQIKNKTITFIEDRNEYRLQLSVNGLDYYFDYQL